jgi:hypothetical protein
MSTPPLGREVGPQVPEMFERESQGHSPQIDMTKQEALALVTRGEGQTIEFKETPGQINRAIKTLAAFASQQNGGSVLIGFRDDGTPVPGFQLPQNAAERIAEKIKENTISMVTAEPLLPQIHTFTDPEFAVIHVGPGREEDGPYLAFGRRWKRVGRSTHEVQMNYRQLARAYSQHLWDSTSDEALPYRFCRHCGSQRLNRSQALDYSHDRLYYIIECEDWRLVRLERVARPCSSSLYR